MFFPEILQFKTVYFPEILQFKTAYFLKKKLQKNIAAKLKKTKIMTKVPNESKLIYVINISKKVFCCPLISLLTVLMQRKNKMPFLMMLPLVSLSSLKFTFTLNAFYLRIKTVIILTF